ncbi:Nramp family divalent metal transporter [Zunongwangia profunda]|uniref:Manganese transport protein MntH n=2 Tax=Zunongwangia profunda TaxID=398743 RepID=D5BG16_ZUNPS|nr:Nramp family divalent metal transporter [Zunongwangia profunda]ADF53129.1 manganese transport protein MntH [Zunongwangia profunda SM-A87]MAG88249.1 divalent metal cation transporter [Flavobacteriaceae bacterium]MAS69418.1 divalent metal cation transporter [Zunongwangia sp.]HCV82216.1 divalent metal cation transporter [Zunongwangia profunda]
MKNYLKELGPGILVSAAFIGPGTVTSCTLAGVNFGYSLLWALLLSVFSCIVLQEMAARLGIISQKGLSDNIRDELKKPVWRFLALALIFSAIVVGNAAYEAGNITGAVLGLQAVFGEQQLRVFQFEVNIWSITVGAIAFAILWIGNYKVLEKVFIALVMVMSLAFIVTAIVVKPDISKILNGFIPNHLSTGILGVIALVGTTVVPYNLFLHASLVSEKWKEKKFLKTAKIELVIAIVLGGVVSMAILICAAAAGLDNVNNAVDLAEALKPVFGEFASWFMAIGLLAAGITSSITAPLAAAYVVKGCMGWNASLKSVKFKAVWAFVLILGVFCSSLKIQPIQLIQFAQIANGILLPVIAVFLFWVVNRASVLGNYKNSLLQNILGAVVIAIAIFLGGKSIYTVL